MENTKKELNVQEIVGYICLALLVIGNITVGKYYLFAQIVYLIANGFSTIRSFVLKQPSSDKVRNVVFTGITIALIIIALWK